jgi:hypothetical protein
MAAVLLTIASGMRTMAYMRKSGNKKTRAGNIFLGG